VVLFCNNQLVMKHFSLTLNGQSYSYIYIHNDYNIVVGLERGPLSLVSTTEELLDRKVAAPV
jgi:hypothetical protein